MRTIDLAAMNGRALATNRTLPYVFPPSSEWLGNDGLWSTFEIALGNPPKVFHILPATNIQETWVPLPEGCPSSNFISCTHLRGILPNDVATQKGFQLNQSSTWVNKGIYNLLSEENLGYNGNGEYGFDTLRLGSPALGGPSLDRQVIAGIVTDDFYLGMFGLGPKPANFSDYDNPIPSFMRTLVNKNIIPSLSYGYTAGAKYGLDGFPGSLTLGGFDESRFVPNNVSLNFDSNDSRSLTLAIQSITANNTLEGAVTPLSMGILALVDSTVPHIWLPASACIVFERAFGLSYDNTTDLYTVNDTVHERLRQLNPTVTLKIGDAVSGGEIVGIELPYGAFDLQASSPIYANATNYFPIRRAGNETQYTLGRTFLQEAYVIADYERMNFSVSQAVFTNASKSRIIAINPKNYTTNTTIFSEKMHSSTSPGEVGGIVGGLLAIAALVLFLGWLCLRRRRKQQRQESHATPRAELSVTLPSSPAPKYASHKGIPEHNLSAAGTDYGELPAYSRNEKSSSFDRRTKPQELLGSPAAAELGISQVSPRSQNNDQM